MKINIQTDIRWAFFYFLVVVCLGFFLRLTYVIPMPFEYNYRYLLHAHSHTAFLGWIYVLLTALISREFFSIKDEKIYRKWFYFTQIAVLGMLFTFPFQGYGVFSIIFSSIFVFLSYYYAYFFFKKSELSNLEEKKIKQRMNISYCFVKMGVFYLILSSLGIWAIPFSIIKFGKDSDFYRASIAFFLHFQYNGWILSSLMGLFIRWFRWELRYPSLLKKIFYGFQVGVLGTLVISWLGIFPLTEFYLVGGIFTVIWLCILFVISYLYFFKNKQKSFLGSLFLLFFVLKLCVMLLGLILRENNIFNNPDLIISYLHLNFLGIINIGLLFFLAVYKLLIFNKLSIYLYLLAFIVTEILIVYKGFFLWFDLPFLENYFQYLTLGSSLFLIVALYWVVRSVKIRKI
ncbi:MAG: hypothetical protein Q4C98_04635 [Capnocytophaga sp.]|nr:hypothetical protein [Capnocytophaga sp.]